MNFIYLFWIKFCIVSVGGPSAQKRCRRRRRVMCGFDLLRIRAKTSTITILVFSFLFFDFCLAVVDAMSRCFQLSCLLEKIKIADWIVSFYLSCLLSPNGDKRAACSPWNQFQIIGYGFLVIAFVYFISVSWNEGIAWWIMSFKKVSKNQVLKSGRSLSVIVVNDNEIRVIQCNTHLLLQL